ncbi:NAD(P)H-dependent D-xylose reductase xyl1 [Penicillium alfredii]|uniref:D-xylose reductase [NAD(P)H] n=1 Tax=Penicillium alfredii TaxID=1506179 RepID=A0A9W9JXM9_9EURO|nr:NAD(P)H-dependent D-xylose reductase xyl1 [Penicillium alfredii]KAJ5084812.1 NAD(P)H-dependent D-xylose reductase xyl1 [Penicillium alfredii]
MAAPTIKLNSGYDMPLVDFGLWKVSNDTCADQVYNAIKAGYRCFDGACDYGNEVEAGQGVARAINEGLVTREELFIVSKLWNSFHEEDQVERVCRKQLDDWGISYFDLYIVHFPIALKFVDPSVRYPPGWTSADDKLEFSSATIRETWTAMETLVDAQLARSIGVSNFNAQLLMDLLRFARVRPATLQIEHHPYLTQPRLVEYAQREGPVVTAYSSFGPLSFLELELDDARDTPLLFDHATVAAIADKNGRTPAEVLLRWATQRHIAAIPKSNNPTRLAQNLQVTDFDIEAGEIEAISALNKGLRFNDPIAANAKTHRDEIDILHLSIRSSLQVATMSSPSVLARLASGQVHITTSPVPRSLGESKLVLAALQKFGDVITFRNLKPTLDRARPIYPHILTHVETQYDTTNDSKNDNRSIVAIFESTDAAQRAIAASPLTVDLPQDSSSSVLSKTNAPSELTCTIQASYHNHERAMRRSPFYSTYNIFKNNAVYEDLTGRETGIPLPALGDALARKKYYISNRVKDKVRQETECMGAGSLMGLWREGMEYTEDSGSNGSEEHKETQGVKPGE